jgi:hypothetical protein
MPCLRGFGRETFVNDDDDDDDDDDDADEDVDDDDVLPYLIMLLQLEGYIVSNYR